jgi:nucleoside-diphosphate-sugar epimerase
VTRILVTGASGFVGRALVADLAKAGYSVRAAMRLPADIFPRSVEVVAVSDLTRPVEWRALLKDMVTVVHLAGIAHAGPGIAEDAYDRVNRLATAELASAVKAGRLRHLIFMSSIRAQSGPASDTVLREDNAAHPTDAYGRSKLAAEHAIRAAGVPFTILRPVLIYGTGVKGNLARLIQIARSPWPLPLGLCRNRRSLLSRQNLIDAIHLALTAPAALNQTCIVADPDPLTLTEIVAALRTGLGRNPRLLPIPTAVIAAAARALGREDEWQRLGGSLVAEPSKLLGLGWRPSVGTKAGLAALMRDASTGETVR